MKILLTGATGLLGREIHSKLKAAGEYEIMATAYSRSGDGISKLNLLDTEMVEKLIKTIRPDLIIHSAAERRPDIVKQSPDQAEKLNVSTVKTIAEAAESAGSAVLYMSTDYVFDGTAPPYYPDSEPNPLNEYGRMKLAGEQLVQQYCSKAIILRVPILYGNVETIAESAVTAIAEKISAENESFHDNEAIRYPTHTADVAGVIGGLAQLFFEKNDISGIYQWSSEKPYTKYTIAKLMAEIKGVDPGLIKEAPEDPAAAPRPKDSHLDTDRIKSLGLGTEINFKSTLEQILTGF